MNLKAEARVITPRFKENFSVVEKISYPVLDETTTTWWLNNVWVSRLSRKTHRYAIEMDYSN
jgi:hypothetical protein